MFLFIECKLVNLISLYSIKRNTKVYIVYKNCEGLRDGKYRYKRKNV